MNRWRVLLACWLLALASCASDGGQRGTGITVAEGNIASVHIADSADGRPSGSEPAGAAAAGPRAGIEGIEVSLEGTDLRTITDADGLFSLRGDFAGDTALHFDEPTANVSARLPVNAPAGGTLTLHDVVLDGAAGTARAGTMAVSFTGSVVTVVCGESRIEFVSTARAADDTDTYVVVLTDSTLQDREGRPLACADVSPGDEMDIRGFFASDGTIGDAEVTRR